MFYIWDKCTFELTLRNRAKHEYYIPRKPVNTLTNNQNNFKLHQIWSILLALGFRTLTIKLYHPYIVSGQDPLLCVISFISCS